MQDVADLSLHVTPVPTPVKCKRIRRDIYLLDKMNNCPCHRPDRQVKRETKTRPQLVGVADSEELATSSGVQWSVCSGSGHAQKWPLTDARDGRDSRT
jgi:hypothetical protein